MHTSHKWICTLIGCISMFFISCTQPARTAPQTDSASTQPDSVAPAKDTTQSDTLKKDTLTFVFCGDIMMGTTFPDTALPPNDGKNLFKDCLEWTVNADLTLGNLEGTLCDGGKTDKKPGKYCYAFRTPVKYVKNLVDAGFDYVSMANNHANDFGQEGILSTEQALSRNDIAFSGISGRKEYAVVERAGYRIGICAFGHNGYTIRHLDTARVKGILQQLRDTEKADILIVSFHGGAEGRDKAHLPQGKETFLGEDRGDLRRFAHLCIDLGADIVYGHGPHVPRCMELYNDRIIAYSLGNFCTPYGVSLTGISGYAPLLEVKTTGNGTFVKGHIHSMKQVRGIGPRLDQTHAAAQLIKSLTESDISNPGINIGNTGEITKK